MAEAAVTGSWPYPRCIAHRCGGRLAPENTLAGLREAARHGCRGVEFDVMLSRDATPYLMHDETLERTTDGHGRLAETDDATLDRLDAGRGHDARFAGEPLPTLAAALRACQALGLWANIEIKPATGQEAPTGQRVALEARQLWRQAPAPLLSSFSVTALEAARRAAPELPRALLVEAPSAEDWQLCRRLQCLSLHGNVDKFHEDWLIRARQQGVFLLLYTVNDPVAAQRLLAAGVSAVFTDRIDELPAGST